MLRILLPFSTACSAALAACTPSPEDTAMRSSGPISGATIRDSSEAKPEAQAVTRPATGQAAQGPMLEPVSAAENPAPAPAPAPASTMDTPAEALGRRTLSTAFVRIGPDGLLTVELRDGRVLVLRDMVMHARKYCGVPVLGGEPGVQPGVQYCGGYADVAAARPGGAPASDAPHP